MVNKKKVVEEFSNFAKKIGQLESLRHELHSLDTSGFELEAKAIESQLHDVKAIPKIIKEMELLRKHIAAKSVKSPELGGIKKKIKEIESELDKKKGLSSQEEKNVKEIPKLEGELHNLHKKVNAHMDHPKVKIDAGVGVLVDSRFDDFINEIKAELTSRVKEKEDDVKQKLMNDLRDREEVFAEHYKELIKEYHEKYKERVKNELDKEVKEKFEQELKERLKQEEKEMVSSLIRENNLKLSKQREEMIEKLERDYQNKAEKMEREAMKKVEKEKKRVNSATSSYKKKVEELERKEREIEAKGAQKSTKVAKEKAKLSAALTKLNLTGQREIEAAKKKVDKQIVAFKRNEEKTFVNKVMAARNQIQNEMREKLRKVQAQQKELMKAEEKAHVAKLKAELEKEESQKLKKAVEEKEKEIRRDLERKYELRLQEELREREAIIESKKADLEKHILAQAKRLFK